MKPVHLPSKTWKSWLRDVIYVLLLPFLMGLYFLIAGNKEREPTFYVEPIRTQIIDIKNVQGTPLQIQRADGKVIRNDIISVTFYFFNQGKETIRRENVYSDIKIMLSDSIGEILDFKILKSERPVSGIKAFHDTTNNLISIDFEALEEFDGLVGQITYEGSINVPLIIEGGIDGTKSFKSRLDKKYFRPSLILIAMLWIGLSVFQVYMLKRFYGATTQRTFYLILFVILTSYFIVLAFLWPDIAKLPERDPIPETLKIGQIFEIKNVRLSPDVHN